MSWNKCDVCGRFIAYQDFDSGRALRQHLPPSIDIYGEIQDDDDYETLCPKHYTKLVNAFGADL